MLKTFLHRSTTVPSSARATVTNGFFFADGRAINLALRLRPYSRQQLRKSTPLLPQSSHRLHVGRTLASSAPAVKPAPKRGSERTVFDKLGGWPALEAAVTKFYEKVVADPLLAPHFEGIPMEKQRQKQLQFMALAFGAKDAPYMGKAIDVAHRKMIQEAGVGLEHFDHVADHFVTTLQELGVAEDIINEAAEVVLSTRPMFDPEEVNRKHPETAKKQ